MLRGGTKGPRCRGTVQLGDAIPLIAPGAVAAGPRYECAAVAAGTATTDGARLPRFDTAKDIRPSISTRCRRVGSVLCVWADRASTDELHQVFAGMCSGSIPCQSMSACKAVGLCPADCRRRLYFATSPYPHLELNKDGTSYFIRCGLPMPRWYRPQLVVGPARAALPAMPNQAVPEYRAAYPVRAATLPHPATPALPAPPTSTPTSVLTEAGPTRCVRQLMWTPGVFVMDPGSAERVIATALRPGCLRRRRSGCWASTDAPLVCGVGPL